MTFIWERPGHPGKNMHLLSLRVLMLRDEIRKVTAAAGENSHLKRTNVAGVCVEHLQLPSLWHGNHRGDRNVTMAHSS